MKRNKLEKQLWFDEAQLLILTQDPKVLLSLPFSFFFFKLF